MSDFENELQAAKVASVAHAIIRCARLLNERGVARMREVSGLPVRMAHLRLFPHIDLEGTRATEVARRLGVSKQAVAPLVRDLVSWGFLESRRDPADGRAQLLCFSEAPGRSILDGMAVLGELDVELRDQLGPERFEALRNGLAALDELLS